MKRYVILGLITACAGVSLLGAQVALAGLRVPPMMRFAPVHIYLDPGNKAPAAYQFELKATAGQIKIVGVEGGEHPAFQEAPYYDPAALMNERIIIAAFSTGSNLPRGRTRVATIHLQILGDVEPEYELNLAVAADAEGREFPAELALEKGDNK